MKKLISALLILTLSNALTPQVVWGALSELDKSQIGVGNTLVNPSAEGSTAGYSKSGGSFSIGGTVAGQRYFSWDSNAAGQTILSGYQTISSGDAFSSRNGVVSAAFKCSSGTCTHKLQVYDGANILNEAKITSSTSQFVKTSLNFIYPQSGVISWRLISVAADEPTVYWREGYRGLAEGYNLFQVSQAQDFATAYWAGTTGCTWETTSTSWGTASANASCPTPTVTGNAQAPATKIPAITFPSLGPGTYEIQVTGTVSNNGAGGMCYFRVTDGTSSTIPAPAASSALTGISGQITYTSPQSNITFTLQSQSQTSGTSCGYLASIAGSRELQIRVKYFPSQSKTGYKPDQTPASWSGYLGGASCAWGTTSTSWADFPGTSNCSLTEVYNRNFGAVTAYGGATAKPGIVFTPSMAGRYEVCASMGAVTNTTTSDLYMELRADSNIIDNYNFRPSTASYANSAKMCGILDAPSTNPVTVAIFGMVGNGTGQINKPPQSSGNRVINWTIKNVDATTGALYFTGNVTSNAQGQERVERATITNNGTLSIASQSGSWATLGSSSPTSGGGTLNITGFSSTPTCQCTLSNGTTSTNNEVCYFSSISSSAITWRVYNQSSASQNESVGIICMGPR